MEEAIPSSAERYLERLRLGRKTPAVLKSKLVQLRSTAPEITIFAFEGDDDKVVYSQWIRRIRPDLDYEPFPCDGKNGVLMLLAVVSRDRGGLEKNIYFFIDRDYDDLRGMPPQESVFMTDKYSVENYLVSPDVVTELLKNEFHCHTKLEVRDAVTKIFEGTYDEFLKITKEINRRIFVARKLGIKLRHALPTKANVVANVELTRAKEAEKSAIDLVVYFSDPDETELQRLNAEFEALNPRDRYRGKFALSFFQRWLSLLTSEYVEGTLGLFAAVDAQSRVRTAELVISNFASKSALPHGLQEFIRAV